MQNLMFWAKRLLFLIWASNIRHFEIVKYLIDHGADPNAKDDIGRTALILASENGQFEIVKCLIEHGADPNANKQ